MKLTYLEIEGFRGVKGKLQLDFAPGFAIISGRNGSGKSTVCDAIEYALTGSIRRYASRKESNETLQDYLWWRGDDTSHAGRVAVAFVTPTGKAIQIERIGEQLTEASSEALHELLRQHELSQQEALDHLTKTLLIRAESITELSLDLSESERFKLVRDALGSIDVSDLERTLSGAASIAQRRITQLRDEYDSLRKQKLQTESDLSALRAEASRTGAVKSAEEEIRASLGDSTSGLERLLTEALSKIGALRAEADAIARAATEVAIPEDRGSSAPISLTDQQSKLTSVVRQLTEELERATGQLEAVERALADGRGKAPGSTARKELIELGLLLGLQQGTCPLCGSAISDEQYHQHIDTVSQAVAAEASLVAGLVSERQRLRTLIAERRDTAEKTSKDLNAVKTEIALIERRRSELREKLSNFGLDAGDSRDQIKQQLDSRRAQVLEHAATLERSAAVLNAMKSIARLKDVERAAAELSARVDRVESSITKHELAEAHNRAALHTVRRFVGEQVDERLAQLSPLLQELYGRLKPHIGWKDFDFKLRGDVRRLLSLRVGEDLSPGFMFSSGQRRAAGLSFLLAVNLVRSWPGLRTIVLDDPVQHIDDFRALHLVETLASMRQLGIQVVCTVEDEELGELLARRLRPRDGEEGVRFRLTYRVSEGVCLERREAVKQLPDRVLLVASGSG